MSGELGAAIRAMCSTSLLDAKQERELAKRIKQGDKEARDIMILANMRLVVALAKQYHQRRGVPLEDGIMEGALGLLRAVDLYDPRKGRFTTYATNWVQQRLRRFSQDYAMVRIPSYKETLLGKLERLMQYGSQEKLVQDFSRAAKTAYTQKDIEELVENKQRANIRSLDAVQTVDRGEDSHGNGSTSPDSPVQLKDFREQVKFVVDLLPLRERYVITMRYLAEPQLRLEDVGNVLRLTRERVRQIEVRALNRLRRPEYAVLLGAAD